MAADLDAIREHLAGRVPEGYDLANLVLVPVAGQAHLEAVSDTELAEFQRKSLTAAMPKIDDRGRPTLLKIDAWMAHGEVANKNGQFFLNSDLEAVADTLAKAPDFLVMDWNHSAVIPHETYPKAIGAWYDVAFEMDPAANGGQGAMGLRAKGILWAWLFPEQANILLGEQARNGYAAFSMAAVPKHRSFRKEEATDRMVTVLHEPVFFTLSALDVLPADPDARGAVTLAHAEAVAAPVAARIPEEPRMTPEEIATLEAAKLAAETKVAELETQLAALQSEKDEKIAALETSLSEMTSAREALVAEKTQEILDLVAAYEALKTENAAVVAELEVFKTEKAQVLEAQLLAARLESLPESFRKAHEARTDEQRARMEAKWKGMSDTEWAEYKQDELLFGFEKASLSYTERSNLEGGLLPTGGTDELKSRLARITK